MYVVATPLPVYVLVTNAPAPLVAPIVVVTSIEEPFAGASEKVISGPVNEYALRNWNAPL